MRFLAICPRLKKTGDSLHIMTGVGLFVLTLGLMQRQVVIDPVRRVIVVSSRYAWFFTRHREMPFSDVEAVTYGYEELSAGSSFSWNWNSLDSFIVGLRLVDDSEFTLFTFWGEGQFNNDGPFPDWLYFCDLALDLVGSQDKESRLLVDLLSKIVDVSVVPPRGY